MGVSVADTRQLKPAHTLAMQSAVAGATGKIQNAQSLVTSVPFILVTSVPFMLPLLFLQLQRRQQH